MAAGRSPHGERGLKYSDKKSEVNEAMSLPSRGAWIEICRCRPLSLRRRWSLPSRGAWIEIGKTSIMMWAFVGRSPHGERGLKYKNHSSAHV